MEKTSRYTAPLLWAALSATLVVACEPLTITEARNQLRRGGSRVTRISMPVAEDSVTVDVGSKLQFNNLAFSPFNYSFSQMLHTSQQTATITFPAPPAGFGAETADIYPAAPPPTRFTTAAGSSVQSATADSGYIRRSFTNGTGCSVTVNTSLTDSLGNSVAFLPLNAVVANGATLVDSLNASATPITVSGFAQVNGSASTGACVPGNPNVSVGVTFKPLRLSSVVLRNVNESFNQTYNALQSEPRIQAVDTVVVSTGSVSLTLQNRLPIADTLTVRLNGVTKAGVVVTGTLVVAAASGNGVNTTSGTLTFDLAGARILPAAVVAQVTGTAKANQATITTANSTNAVVVSGGGSLVVQSLSGKLDPAATPELTVSLQNSQALPDIYSSEFGNIGSQTTVDSATAALTIVNTSGAPLQLSNFSLRAAQTDAAGQPLKDFAGNIIFEKDAAGNPITLTVADVGKTTYTVGRNTTRSTSLAAAPLLDRVLHLLLDNKKVALVAGGTGIVGDQNQSTISRTDNIKVRFRLTVGVNVTTVAP